MDKVYAVCVPGLLKKLLMVMILFKKLAVHDSVTPVAVLKQFNVVLLLNVV
jgi:hypothetical protein